MIIRMQRGSLRESLETVAEIEPTIEAIRAHLRGFYPHMPQGDWCKIEVKEYGYDVRTHWETYIVVLEGFAIAFTDGPVES